MEMMSNSKKKCGLEGSHAKEDERNDFDNGVDFINWVYR
jgi:hypothetical protein